MDAEDVRTVYANGNYGERTSDFKALSHRCLTMPGDAGRIAELVAPRRRDFAVLKPRHSAMYATPLHLLLEQVSCNPLIVTGTADDSCVLFTAMYAYLQGYLLWVPVAGVAAESQGARDQALAQMARVLKADTYPLPGSHVSLRSFTRVTTRGPLRSPTMKFNASEPLTFGLELELEIVDVATGQLAPCSMQLFENLQRTPYGKLYALEATQSTIELNSSVHRDAASMHGEVHARVLQLQDVAASYGVAVCGGGTHVAQFWNEREVTPSRRARELDRRFGFLPKRFSTYGMHVHVGMPDENSAVRVANVLQAHTPLLIAMAAASPFLQHVDSGFAASRPLEPLVYPHGGPMPYLQDWAHLESLVHEFFSTGIAESLKDIYWDVRPKPEFGTVEVRVFDTPLSVTKAVNLAAWTRAIAGLVVDGKLDLPEPRRYITESKVSRFLACRDGLQAKLFDPVSRRWLIAREWARSLCEKIVQHQPTPMDKAALEAVTVGIDDDEDHTRMRRLWQELSPLGRLPEGSAPSDEILAAYSAHLCNMLLEQVTPGEAS